MEIKDKVVVITGGANGIGKACAQELHKTYANIIIVDIDKKNGEDIEKIFFSKQFQQDQRLQKVSNYTTNM